MLARRSLLAGFALLALVACARQGERAAGSAAGRSKVLFIGLDGADWRLLDGYQADGTMPQLARLVREGRTAVLETDEPPLSPLLWTTMMTGVSPLEHRILDFTRFRPGSGEREPIGSGERRAAAVWDMASAARRRVAVFGLWATWPAEPVEGMLVSDRLFSFQLREGAPPPGLVWPPEREAAALAVRAAVEAEVTAARLREVLPEVPETEIARALTAPPGPENPIEGLRRIVVETELYDRLARAAIAELHPDLAIVYLQGTDAIGHLFAPFSPPRRAEVPDAEFARYSAVARRYFAQVDALLGRYRALAEDEGAILMLASDHGFRWGDDRPAHLASAAVATAGLWHAPEGIALLHGPGVAPSPARARGRIDQVAATLLALLALPPGAGLAGPPLFDLPASKRPAVAYRRPAAPQAVERVQGTDGDELARLRALGYLGADEPARAPAAGGASDDPTRTPGSFVNEGLLLRARERSAEAEAAFERALALDPDSAAALANLSDLLESERRDPARADELLLRAAARHVPDGVPRLLARGKARLGAGDCTAAGRLFAAAIRLAPGDALTWASAALGHLCAGDAAAARRALERSLALDPNQPAVERALADLR